MSKPKRILMLLENNSYPDDTRVILEAESLTAAGFDVTVICPTGDSTKWYEVVDGVRVYRYPCPAELNGFGGYIWEYSYSFVATFVISIWVFMRHGFDSTHSHTPPDIYCLIGRFYQFFGKKYVHDTHDLSPELYKAQRGGSGSKLVMSALRWFEKCACRWANRLIATNETQSGIQVSRCGADPNKCCVVRNGPSERFLGEIVPNQKFALMEKTILGYVGVIGVQDGVDYMIRMIKHLRYDLGREDFHAVIVGDGSALVDLQELAAELKVADAITFTGYVAGDELLQTIASFDIAVTPDPSNPYNDSCTTIKTMEYMAMSKPTVAFDLPENRHSARESAVYATCNDESELARLTQELIDNPERRIEMGRIGRKLIQEEFAWEYQRQNLIDLYDSLFPN